MGTRHWRLAGWWFFFFLAAVAARPAPRLNIEAVSVSAGGVILAGNNFSLGPVWSGDGRYLAFVSAASNLTTDDLVITPQGGYLDVYLRELVTGQTRLVSWNATGTSGGNGHSLSPSLSQDGRWIAFESEADDLTSNDANGASDIFVRDLVTGRTLLVSFNAAGSAAGNGASTNPILTPDGRYVVFESAAEDLVSDDGNGLTDVFRRDLQTGETLRVSAGALSSPGLAGSESPVVTPDGRYVALLSFATNLVAGVTNTLGEVYLRDMQSGVTTWASQGLEAVARAYFPFATTLRLTAYAPVMSNDGRFVAFSADVAGTVSTNLLLRFDRETGTTVRVLPAVNFPTLGAVNPESPSLSADGQRLVFAVPVTTNGLEVVLWDALTGVTSVVSRNADNSGSGNSASDTPVISADGQRVAFLSSATDLVTPATDGTWQVFVRDFETAVTLLVSADAQGAPGGGCDSAGLALSPDGNLVAFESQDGTLAAGDGNGEIDVFVRDLTASTTTLVSAATPGAASTTAQGNSSIAPNCVSADGQRIVFMSDAADLVPGVSRGRKEIHVRDRARGTNGLISANLADSGPGNGYSSSPVISGNGRFVAFVSEASDLVADDTNAVADVFLRDLQTGATRLISVNAAGATGGNAASSGPALSADGHYVAFVSRATDLVPGSGDTANTPDFFVRDTLANTTTLLRAGSPFSSSTSLAVTLSVSGRFVAAADFGTGGGRGVRVFDLLSGTNWQAALSGYSRSAAPTLVFSADEHWLAFDTIVNSSSNQVVLHDLLAKTNHFLPLRTYLPSLNANGRWVACQYFSLASGHSEILLYDRESSRQWFLGLAPGFTNADGHSYEPQISGDGRFVVFRSRASNLLPDDANGFGDIFGYDVDAGALFLITRSRNGPGTADAPSSHPILAGDGRTLVFESAAADLVAGDLNVRTDVFATRLPDADTDTDTLPDWWELAQFDTLTYGLLDDPDHDGIDNRAEFLAGTNPSAAASVPALSVSQSETGGVTLSWAAPPGRGFQLYFKEHLEDSNWIPLPLDFLGPGPVVTIRAPDWDAVPQQFFRLEIRP